MKKYYQAILALTAALSLIALLFYRHEYNKLRFVLQVLNYFGTPTQKGDHNCTSMTTPIWNNYDLQFKLPESSWQRVTDDLYIYSAYNIHNGKVRAIGFGKNIDSTKYSCSVYFDDNVESIMGEFSYDIIENVDDEPVEHPPSEYHGCLLTCKFTQISKKIVVGIEFKSITQKKFDIIPVIHVHTLNDNVNRNESVICIAPSTIHQMSHVNIISFLAFHHYIGLNNFVIYNSAISHVLSNTLERMARMSGAQWNFTYTNVPWNFPYAQISHGTIRKIIETDCIYRTYNKAIMTVTLSWNEYINLRNYNSIENVFQSITDKNHKLVTNKLRLNTLMFCLNQIDDDLLISTPIMLKTVRRLKKIFKNQPHYIYKLTNNFNTNITEKDVGNLIFVNRYQQCNIEDKREIIDDYVLKFAKYVPNTKIFQYYHMRKSFNN